MRLGEFVGIMAARPTRDPGSISGTTGSWTSPGIFDQPVEQLQLHRMDHILGVVQHHRLGRPPGLRFMSDQRGVKAVEAVGLGGRPVRGDLDREDARIVDARDRGPGRRIVAIMADEQPDSRASPNRSSVARSIGAMTLASSQAGMSTAIQPGRIGEGRSPANILG